MEIEHTTPAKVADKGHDWRAEVGASNSGCSVDLARAREPGRGREAKTPEQIPPRGWKDILWRVVVLPMILKFVGLATTTEWLLAILRWPILLVTIVVSLACIYRYGPSRRDAQWRWVIWGSILGALLWMVASMLFSWYVATFDNYNKIYGSLGAGVGFMVWLWI